MKKSIFAFALLFALSNLSGFAQFEKGKKYVGASLSGAGLSYNSTTDLSLGVGAQAGFFFEQDWLLLGEVGIDYSDSDLQNMVLGAKARYYIEQNGLFLGCGARYVHGWKSYNDFQFTPEVGYCFFLNGKITLEPAAYFNISCSDFSNHSEVGVRVGLGFYF